MEIKDVINKLKQLENNAHGYHFNNEVVGMDVREFEELMVFCYHHFEKQLSDNKTLN